METNNKEKNYNRQPKLNLQISMGKLQKNKCRSGRFISRVYDVIMAKT